MFTGRSYRTLVSGVSPYIRGPKLTRLCAPLLLAGALALPTSAQTRVLTTRAANRILEQATWGPVIGGSADLETRGLKPWFLSQVSAPASTYADQPLLNSSGSTNADVSPVQRQLFQNALSGQDQLRQRVAFALSEIWVVSNLELENASGFPPLLRIFQQRAFSNYEQLMTDVTLNPAMGTFLNMANNDKANAASGTAANENYARELMQLFTLGLVKLHDDGTPALDANGNSVPTYSLVDVTNMAKALTGWTYGIPPKAVNKGHNPIYDLTPMIPYELEHDQTAKTLIGVSLPAGQTAQQDLAQALHIVFLQDSLPPFVSKQLIQHLVTSNPTPAYVQRVADAFKNNGAGVRGDLQAVVYAILSDPEARAADSPTAVENGSAFGHMREPILLTANLLRALNGKMLSTSAVSIAAENLEQTPFYAPSVFSYFSPGYRAADGSPAPEFQIYSTQNASTRLNVINSVIYAGHTDNSTTFDITQFVTAATTSNAALTTLISTEFFHQDMSTNLLNAIDASLLPLKTPSDKAKAALYVALTSNEYQIIH